MECNKVVEQLVESARRSARTSVEPDALLRTHLRTCASCLERWEAERNLNAHLRMMRIVASVKRSPDARREALMQQFAAQNPASMRNAWLWTMAAAAVLLLAIAFGSGAARKSKALPAPDAAENVAENIEASAGAQIDPNDEGFIAVPYVPPLAAGEAVSVVHTELYPAALASLGVTVDPAWTTELPADLLVGQDGFPRAVRVSDDYSYTRGY